MSPSLNAASMPGHSSAGKPKLTLLRKNNPLIDSATRQLSFRLRSERAAARGHEAVDERNARQLSQQETAERATYVVTNDGTPSELEAELASILERLAG